MDATPVKCIYLTVEGCRIGMVDGVPTDEQCGECMGYTGPDRGMGDKIARLVKATRIDKVVEKVTRGDCGCGKRRKKLNEAFPSKD